MGAARNGWTGMGWTHDHWRADVRHSTCAVSHLQALARLWSVRVSNPRRAQHEVGRPLANGFWPGKEAIG